MGLPALISAARAGHAGVVQKLLASGAHAHLVSSCALEAASEGGHQEVVRLLMESVAVG